MRLRGYSVSFLILVALFSAAQDSPAGNSETERTFPQAVAVVQAALQKLPGATSGRLPVLDGFVVPGAHSLSAYQRPFYQCTVRVTAAKAGGSLVRVTAKITAWSSNPGHSGYETIESNGRIESDLLDRLQDALVASPLADASPEKRASKTAPVKSQAPEVDAPSRRLPIHSDLSIPSAEEQVKPQERAPQREAPNTALQQEAASLEDLLRNQSHPTNLVAVRRDGTPLLQNPSVDAKVLFLASAEDEFEVLDENPNWVHVRISGLSRGWLRRSAVEMLGDPQPHADREALPPPRDTSAPASTQSAAPFSVGSEEIGAFPGVWEPLKGKNVRIISLQQAPGTGQTTSPQEKRQIAEALFKKESRDLSADAAGLVLVFDSEDGGMVASSRSALEQWIGGTLSDSAFWKQCFQDPPEILGTN